MINQREARIAMDYLTGMTVGRIAEREGVTSVRIYQILNRVTHWVTPYGAITHIPKSDLDKVAARLHDRVFAGPRHIESGQACTPEEFYQELMGEPKKRNYGQVPDPVLHEERPMESDIG
jgi:hypothetical protein